MPTAEELAHYTVHGKSWDTLDQLERQVAEAMKAYAHDQMKGLRAKYEEAVHRNQALKREQLGAAYGMKDIQPVVLPAYPFGTRNRTVQE